MVADIRFLLQYIPHCVVFFVELRKSQRYWHTLVGTGVRLHEVTAKFGDDASSSNPCVQPPGEVEKEDFIQSCTRPWTQQSTHLKTLAAISADVEGHTIIHRNRHSLIRFFSMHQALLIVLPCPQFVIT
jgi:hypothetical protein